MKWTAAQNIGPSDPFWWLWSGLMVGDTTIPAGVLALGALVLFWVVVD